MGQERRTIDAGVSTLAVATGYDYDSFGRLHSLTHQKGSNQSTLAGYVWTFDTNNRVTSFTNSVDGTVNYRYDGRGQLVGADYSTSQSDEDYVYDLGGNRAYAGYQTGPGNQLLEDGTFRYEHDAEGNRTAKVRLDEEYVGDEFSVEYAYDHRQRLIGVTFRDEQGAISRQVAYEYDVFDRRTAKLVDINAPGTNPPFDKTFYAYDGDDVLLEFYKGNATGSQAASLTRRFLNGPAVDQLLAEQDAVTGAVLYHLADHLGSIRDTADDEGDVVNHVVFDSFGNLVSETHAELLLDVVFAGKLFDRDTGLAYYEGRWYDPATGRFVSVDPSGLGPDSNPYRYVHNSPTNFIDPDGREPVPINPGPEPPEPPNHGPGMADGTPWPRPPIDAVPPGGNLGDTFQDAADGWVTELWHPDGHVTYLDQWGREGYLNQQRAFVPFGGGLVCPEEPPTFDLALDGAEAFANIATGGAAGAAIGAMRHADDINNLRKLRKARRKPSAQIREEWEEVNGKPWPKDPATGGNQDVSHKKALADGGTNEQDNIEPCPHDAHVQKHKDAGDFKRWGARRGKKR